MPDERSPTRIGAIDCVTLLTGDGAVDNGSVCEADRAGAPARRREFRRAGDPTHGVKIENPTESATSISGSNPDGASNFYSRKLTAAASCWVTRYS